jgi:serine/threonine-protein kinase
MRRLGRYEIGEEIAHGGMGAVLRARDPDLNRDLAVKVLRPELLRDLAEAERRDLLRRFEEEAQITAQLQHPGVVPVHELGHDDAGLPLLVMKLVRGQTLEKLLAARSSPSADLAYFVGIFEQVCQTVAYAHAHNVLHRDLKPLNVMVGRFGEVQVMDWGLAKVLNGAGEEMTEAEARVSTIETLRTQGSSLLTQGALGTWQYMPPEQANGEWDAVDERADVFALGGILCAILTGHAPYTGGRYELKRQAQRGEMAETQAHLDACGADGELTVLAKACLSPERDKRPRDAGELVRLVGEYRRTVEERLRTGERERAAETARAEERLRAAERLREEAEARLLAEEQARSVAEEKARAERQARRRTAALVSVVTAVLLAVGGIAAWSWQQRATRRALGQKEAEGALQETRTVLEGGKEQEQRDPERWQAIVGLACAAVQRAETAVASAGVEGEIAEQVQAIRAEVDQKRRDSIFRVACDRLRLEQAAVREEHFDRRAKLPGYRHAFKEYGIDLGDAAAAGAMIRSSPLQNELLAALEDWARATREPEEKNQLLAVLLIAEESQDRFRGEWRAGTETKDAPALVALAHRSSELPAADVVNLASDLTQLNEEKAAEQLLREGRARFPDDFWITIWGWYCNIKPLLS